ncbi:hypothetical protein IAD21_01611 [Abditibacteriota bacterium]|nr:hypothetical protein IAD21_01611 [Abditibacteriota bacterium]
MKIPLKKRFAIVGWLFLGYLVVGGHATRAQINPGETPATLPLNDYKPPSDSLDRLGKINQLLPYATPVDRKFKGLNKILRLPDGTLFIDADLDTDADGSPRALEIDPDSGQLPTSFNFDNEEGQRQYVDAENVPYIVLPLRFYKDMGIQLGDVAAVIWQGRLVYAIFADEGPKDLIGEGSIALTEALGFDPWEMRDGRLQIVNGIEDHVLMFVFPRSAPDDLTPENINQKTIDQAKPLFEALGGNVD